MRRLKTVRRPPIYPNTPGHLPCSSLTHPLPLSSTPSIRVLRWIRAKLNGCVERAQRTHTEEFYELTNFSLEIASLNRELMAWEHTYNTVRPHQALGYLTPQAFWQTLAARTPI